MTCLVGHARTWSGHSRYNAGGCAKARAVGERYEEGRGGRKALLRRGMEL